MKRLVLFAAVVLSAAALMGCSLNDRPEQSVTTTADSVENPAESAAQASSGDETSPSETAPQETPTSDIAPEETSPPETAQSAELTKDDALNIALENAGVGADEIYNLKNERDEEGGIPIFDIEFETDYGDYNFEIAISSGKIIGADYEVDEEWLMTLDKNEISAEDAKNIVCEKVPGASAEDVYVREEGQRFEGELYFDGIKYEFEIDPNTGRIFDWNADLRG